MPAGKTRSLAGFLLFATLLAGCASIAPQSVALRDQPPTGLPPRVQLTGVPFFPQEDYYCGPAALAMVLNAAGAKVTPEQLVDEVYLPGRKGSLQVEMLAAARRHGLVAYELKPQVTDMLREIADGSPVIALENYGFDWYPVWHYAVVVGYDLNDFVVYRNTGVRERRDTPLPIFETIWKLDRYWSMVAVAPDRVPATAEEDRYAAAVAALERTGQLKAAHTAYGAMLQRWPHSLVGAIGRGNTAYALHDLKTAEVSFRQATREHPDSAAAFNNLAQTLADRNQLQDALAAAERAVEIGGPLLKESQSTLAEIRTRLPPDGP
jgi:tetratricopeptide (TPR) repeat protein